MTKKIANITTDGDSRASAFMESPPWPVPTHIMLICRQIAVECGAFIRSNYRSALWFRSDESYDLEDSLSRLKSIQFNVQELQIRPRSSLLHLVPFDIRAHHSRHMNRWRLPTPSLDGFDHWALPNPSTLRNHFPALKLLNIVLEEELEGVHALVSYEGAELLGMCERRLRPLLTWVAKQTFRVTFEVRPPEEMVKGLEKGEVKYSTGKMILKDFETRINEEFERAHQQPSEDTNAQVS